MKLTRLAFLLIVGAGVFSPACVDAADHAARPGPASIKGPSVTVAVAERSEVVGRISISGTLVPREEVLVNPQINGYVIETINVDVGDQIHAGMLLATLNDSSLAANLTQAEAELLRMTAAVRQAQSQIDSAKAGMVEAESALDRTQKLASSGNISRATLEQARAAALSARAGVASAEDGLEVARAQVVQATSQRDLAAINLSRSQIEAKVGGIISARNAQLGAIATAGPDPMFRIIRDGEIELEAEVIETALGAVKQDDRADVVIAGNGAVVGRVRLISPTVDPTTRLGTVRIALEQHASLRTGGFASGWVITDRRIATTVPATAVLTDQSGAHVQAVQNGRVEHRVVRPGLLTHDGRREILQGLEPGETVVARAGAFFRDGDQITPVQPGIKHPLGSGR
jgi:HlyD family secretion protein